MEHRYAVGQMVELTPSAVRAAAPGKYEIRQTMPASENSAASPRYRIKSVAENHERIAAESELELPTGAVVESDAATGQMQLPDIET